MDQIHSHCEGVQVSNVYKTMKMFFTIYPQFKMDRPVGDERGIYSYIIQAGEQRALYCSKGSTLGDTVSVHQVMMHFSEYTQIPIVMFVDGRWFKFYGKDIVAAHTWRDIHNGAEMVNFTLADVHALDITNPDNKTVVTRRTMEGRNQEPLSFREAANG
jgi:hypothetical protein